jgi:FixJ family two-component response regulator
VSAGSEDLSLPTKRISLDENTLIAIVDDDELVRTSLAGLLRSFGIGAEVFSSAGDLLATDPDRFDCVVSDLQMPGMTGLDLRRVLSERDKAVPVIIVTAYPERVPNVSRFDDGLHLLEKPADSSQLIACIETVLGQPSG